MRQLSLYDIPNIYDRIVQPGPCEEFYDGLASRTCGPVLELACGTGRLTLALARRGRAVFGLDVAPAMLAEARRKAAERQLDVTFVHADMRSFALDRLFPLVIVSCNSLAHLTTHEDLVSCLECVARHLAPEGLLAFDVVNPDIRALGRTEVLRIDLGPNPSSAVAVEELASYDPVTQLRELRWSILNEDGPAIDIAPLVLRQFFPQELPLLLEAAGLELVARYGGFDGAPLQAHSLNQVCLVRPKQDLEGRAAGTSVNLDGLMASPDATVR